MMMMKNNKKQIIISSIIILLPIVAGLVIWNYLPEKMATHWNANGEVDRWNSKVFAIFGIPAIFLIAHLGCVIVTLRDPKNKEQNKKVSNMVLWLMPIFSLILTGTTYAIALGNTIGMDMIVRILIGLMFVILGNYMPKCKQNHTIGVRVTWTLQNEENWNKTHRFTGKLWVLGGIIILATMFIPMNHYIHAFLSVCIVLSFLPMLYSYVYYRKQLKMGIVTKENIKDTTSGKKTSTGAMVVGTLIVVIAGVFLFTGKYEVEFGETSFTIDALYWDDATVAYADIDEIEYRDRDDPKAFDSRTFGYGSFHVLMGEFKNSEFGAYTRYSYTSCDSCVVLNIDGNILVINETNEENTKELYKELVKRVNK